MSAPAASGGRRPRLSTRQQRLVLGFLGIFWVLVVWELLVRAGAIDPLLTSSPVEVVRTFVTEAQHGELWKNLLVSFEEWALGFVLAAAVGIALGLLAGWYRSVREVVEPWMLILYATPHLALVPIFVVWFGLGIRFKVWVGFLGAIFVITLNTMAGARSTEASYLAVAQVYGAGRLKTFLTVVLPGSVPYIMTGLRQGAGLALVGVIFAEFLSANHGIGFYVSVAGQNVNTAEVMVGIVMLAAWGVALGELMGLLESRFQVWRQQPD